MSEQLSDRDWQFLAQALDDPKIKKQLKQKIATKQVSDEYDDSEYEEETAPVVRKRTSGASYRTPPKEDTKAAKKVTVPAATPKKQRVPANIKRKQQYLEACANKDPSTNKQVQIDGKTVSRKKGYKEWYKEQFGPGYNGEKFTIKDSKVAPRKVFQATIVKEAYKLVQNNPALKGRNGNSLRLKIMSSAMKNFEDVYKDQNFLTYIQDPKACSDMINDFAMELEEQIKSKSK